MATTLQDLLHGTQIPGAGNRFYNWAEKISQTVDAGGGGGGSSPTGVYDTTEYEYNTSGVWLPIGGGLSFDVEVPATGKLWITFGCKFYHSLNGRSYSAMQLQYNNQVLVGFNNPYVEFTSLSEGSASVAFSGVIENLTPGTLTLGAQVKVSLTDGAGSTYARNFTITAMPA